MTGHGLWGRRVARLILVLSVALIALAAFVFVAAPDAPGPMVIGSPSLLGWILPAVGVVGVVVGLVWMVRIVRADPEDHPSSWRSRRS